MSDLKLQQDRKVGEGKFRPVRKQKRIYLGGGRCGGKSICTTGAMGLKNRRDNEARKKKSSQGYLEVA